MPKLAFLELDTLDDRREIHTLLDKLPPRARVDYLAWCCRQVYLPNSRVNPQPSVRMDPRVDLACRDDEASDRLTMEIYTDWWKLAHTYHLDTAAATAELVRRVKRKS